MEWVFGMSVGEFLDQHVGVALIVMSAFLVLGIWRLQGTVGTGMLAMERRLAAVETQWGSFNATRTAEAKMLREAIDLLRKDTERIHDRLDRHESEITRLEELHMAESKREIIGQLARNPPEMIYGPVVMDSTDDDRR